MSLYRCAACGSPNVLTDTQAGGIGYNYVKGAVGTVVLGAGGAAAGIESKQQQVFKCSDCGITLTYSMPEELKKMIDAGVANANLRGSLSLMGVHLDWEALKKQYKNIESGFGDEMIKSRKKYDSMNASFAANLVDDGKKMDEKFKNEHSNDEEVIAWFKADALGKKRVEKELPDEINKQKQAILNEYERKKGPLNKLIAEQDEYQTQLTDYKKRLSELGLFHRAEKQKLKCAIELIEKKIEIQNEEIEKEKKRVGSAPSDLSLQWAAEERAKKALEDKYLPIPPFAQLKWISFIDEMEKKKARGIPYWRLIYYYLALIGPFELEEFLGRSEVATDFRGRAQTVYYCRFDSSLPFLTLAQSGLRTLEKAGVIKTVKHNRKIKNTDIDAVLVSLA